MKKKTTGREELANVSIGSPQIIMMALALLASALVVLSCQTRESVTTGPSPMPEPVSTELSPTREPVSIKPSPTRELLYDIDSAKAELNSAMALWDSEGSDTYNLLYTVYCLCPESARLIHLVVKNGVTESSTFLSSGEEAKGFLLIETINDLFELVQGDLDAKAYSLHVNYHSALGYPTYISISTSPAPDAGFWMEVHSYVPGPYQKPERVYDIDSAKAELSSAMALWDSEGLDTYTLEYGFICDCPGVSRAIQLVVESGVMESSTFLDSGEEVTAAQNRHVLETIDGLFDLVQEALDTKVYELRVDYDPVLGFPRHIEIADGEFWIEYLNVWITTVP